MLRGSAAVVEELKPVSHAFRIDGRDHCASASDDIAAGWRSAYTNGTRLLPLYRDAAPVVASAVSIRSAIVFGPFRLLPDERLLLCGGEPVRLGGRAFDLLLALADEAGIVVGKAELMAKVWPCLFVGEGNLKVQVAALRRALGDGRHGRRYIASVPGRGYCFVVPVRRAT